MIFDQVGVPAHPRRSHPGDGSQGYWPGWTRPARCAAVFSVLSSGGCGCCRAGRRFGMCVARA